MAGAPHLEAFLNAARYFIGLKETGNNSFSDSRGRELWNLWGWNASGTPWCAIFVSACAQKAGIANKVIVKDSYAIGVQYKTVDRCGGKWIDGPLINGGHAVTPIPGDLITFGNSQYKGHGSASHVGIVEYVEDNKVHTIEGNASNKCMRKSYSLGYSAINAYVRPDWSRVGDDISSYLSSAGQVTVGPLYQNKNDRHDMTLRQVGYLSGTYDLSNSPSGIAISVINYTSVLGDLYDMFAPAAVAQSTVKVDSSKLQGNIKIAFDTILSMGFNAAATSGIVGCLQAYSNVNPAYVFHLPNKKYLWGICAWNESNMNKLRDKLGYEWNINLSGQLQYMLDDLSDNFLGLVATLKLFSLDATNAEKSAELFAKTYNSYFNVNSFIDKAKNLAKAIYNQLIITQAQIVGNLSNLRDKDGNLLSAKKSIAIPSSVSQTGIIDDYTSYSAWYNRWAKSSPQRKLADIWNNQGKSCNKGVATVGGYYCVAVRPKFGNCGEVIVITLEGGIQFPAIICDEKGEDAGSEWGHVKSGKISIIEWERVKTENGKVITGNIGFTNVDKCGFSDWLKKRVISITNYGKYADVRWT